MALQGFSGRAARANVLIITPDLSDALSCGVRNVLSTETNVSALLLQGPTESSRESVSSLDFEMAIDKIDVVLLVGTRSQLHQNLKLVSALKSKRAEIPVIIVKDDDTPKVIMEYFNAGVSDYITPPLRAVDILPRIWRLVEYGRERATLMHKLKSQIGLRQLVGKSPAFLAVTEKIPVVAQSDVGVQISGETGTGKEMCARAIHYLGPRAGKPFLPVNCGAIPSELVENELFGHVRGAFTGAFTASDGLISESTGGTLFLDEIDCLPLQAQAKLLRFLQEKEYRPIGSPKMRKADIRVIAATNVDLDKAVQERTFRQDLFYRLNIVHLALPALRERREDIPLLARHFLDESAAEAGKYITDFSPEAMETLCSYDWPGNVRELENIVKRAAIFAKGVMILPEEIDLPAAPYPMQPESFQAEKAKAVADFEKQYMQGVLQTHHGNITQAAKAARKNRRAFWELIRKHNIDASKYKPISS